MCLVMQELWLLVLVVTLIFYVTHVKIGLSHGCIIILMRCMIYSSNYEAILKILLPVPGRVGMEECTLDLRGS